MLKAEHGHLTCALVFIVGSVLFAIGIVTRIDDIRPARHADDTESSQPTIGYRALLRSPGIRVVFTFHLLVPLIVFTAFAVLPNFMNDERGVSIATIGVLASAGAVAAFGASLLVSHWRPLTRPFMGMTAILTIAATSMALMLAFTALPIVALALMLRMCFSPIWSLTATAVADVTPERARGRAYGLCEFGVGIGDTSAPIMAGGLYSAGHRLPLTVGFMLTVPLAMAALIVHRHRERFMLAPATEGIRESVTVGSTDS